MSGPKRADIYIRESDEAALDAYSPEQMIADCRRKAAELAATVDRVIVEAGKRDEWECPELLAEIERAKRGEIDYLISWDTARLSGDLGKHLWLKDELKGSRVEIHYATVAFAATDEGELHENLLGLFNRYERMKIRARTQNGIKGKLARKQPIGNGPTPFGIEPVLDPRERVVAYRPNPDTIGVLRRIVAELETRSMRRICDDLNAERVPTPSGRGVWTTGIVWRLVNNPTYAGSYRFGAARSVPGRRPDGKRIYRKQRNDPSTVTSYAIDPVLSPEAVRAARAGMQRRKRRRSARRSEADDPYSLRGVLVCACGGVLSTAKNGRYRRYQCHRAYPSQASAPVTERCRLPEVPAPELEAEVWRLVAEALRDRRRLESVLEHAMDPGEAGRRYERQVASVSAEIGKLERRMQNAEDIMLDFGKGTVQYENAKAASLEASRKQAELARSLEQLERERPVPMTGAQAEAARAAWADLAAGLEAAAEDAAKRRALYRAIDLRVVVALAEPGAGVRLGRLHSWSIALSGRAGVFPGATNGFGFIALWDTQPPAA